MKIRLLKDARVPLKAGEIVEVSPDAALYLTSTRQAVVLGTEAPQTPEEKSEKTARRTTSRKK